MSYTPKVLRESPNQRNYSAFTHPGAILCTTILAYQTGTVTDTPWARFSSADMILVYQPGLDTVAGVPVYITCLAL